MMRPPERESSFRVKQKHKRLTDFAKVTKVNFEDVDDEPVDEVILELRKHLRATGMSTKDANRLYGLCHQRNWPGQFGSKGEETDEMLLVILKKMVGRWLGTIDGFDKGDVCDIIAFTPSENRGFLRRDDPDMIALVYREAKKTPQFVIIEKSAVSKEPVADSQASEPSAPEPDTPESSVRIKSQQNSSPLSPSLRLGSLRTRAPPPTSNNPQSFEAPSPPTFLRGPTGDNAPMHVRFNTADAGPSHGEDLAPGPGIADSQYDVVDAEEANDYVEEEPSLSRSILSRGCNWSRVGPRGQESVLTNAGRACSSFAGGLPKCWG